MKKYSVQISGMMETREWFDVEAEDEDQAEEFALEKAEEAGLDDPQGTGHIQEKS